MRKVRRTVREWWWRLLPAVVQVGGKAQELTGPRIRQRDFALGLRGSQGDRPVGTYPGFLVSFPPVAAGGTGVRRFYTSSFILTIRLT